MKKISKKTIILALSLILCFTASIGIVAAYFTDYESAKGGAVITLSGQTSITEKVKENNKTVVIANVDETDMIVRVKVIGYENDPNEEEPKVTIVKGDWIEGTDGWYYWPGILKGSEGIAGEL